MQFIFQKFQHILERYADINTISRIISIITPFLIAKDQIYCISNSIFPSYIERIVYFDVYNAQVSIKYIAKNNYYQLKNNYTNMKDLPENGYYMFHVWNQQTIQYEYYILRAELLKDALGITRMNNLWAFNNYGLVTLISKYIHEMDNISSHEIIGMVINGIDITRTLKPFMSSISVPDNVCPNVLYMLVQYMNHAYINKLETRIAHCVYIDNELNEISVAKAEDYLVNRDKFGSYPFYFRKSFMEKKKIDAEMKEIEGNDDKEDIEEIEEIFEADLSDDTDIHTDTM